MCFFDPTFWQGLISNLVANLIAGIVIAWPLAIWLSNRQRPDARVIIESVNIEGPVKVLRFAVLNTGQISFLNPVYWYITMFKRLDVVPGSLMHDADVQVFSSEVSKGNKRIDLYNGTLKDAVYPGIAVGLFQVVVPKDKDLSGSIQYRLRTEYGPFPVIEAKNPSLFQRITRRKGINYSKTGWAEVTSTDAVYRIDQIYASE